MRVIWIALIGVALLAGSAAGATKGGSVISSRTRRPRTPTGRSSPPSRRRRPASGTGFSQSYGASGDQARAVAAGLAADLVALSLDPGHRPARRARASSRRTGRPNSHRGIVSDSVVVFVVRDGNPKHIKGWDDLVKPGVAGDHAEPVHLGRRALERDGRLRRAAQGRQDGQAGDRLPEEVLQARSGAARQRPRRRCRSSRRARATSCSRTRTRRSTPRRRASTPSTRRRRTTLLIETPVALTKSGPKKPAAKAFYNTSGRRRRRRRSPRRATGRS